MGDLVRAMENGFELITDLDDGFFTSLSGDVDVRDRIAQRLDAALFESVVAADVRKLATCESFDTMFDRLAQFISQVTTYRWLCLSTEQPGRASLHTCPSFIAEATGEARSALGLAGDIPVHAIADDDPNSDCQGPAPLIREVRFGHERLGTLAMSPCPATAHADHELLTIVANELGGPLRTTTLVEDSRRQATIDPLTRLYNRRAFVDHAARELARSTRHHDPLALVLLDVDHFKRVNDEHGHPAGDRVLSEVGALLTRLTRASDLCARWGGEEFVVLLSSTDLASAELAAERIRRGMHELRIEIGHGKELTVTASFGLAALGVDETLESLTDRADRAMYCAKTAGRNRLSLAADLEVVVGQARLSA